MHTRLPHNNEHRVSYILVGTDKIEKVTENIQTHLNRIQKWAQSWETVINPWKSSVVLFNLQTQKI